MRARCGGRPTLAAAALVALLFLLCAGCVRACTSIIVGTRASKDGSVIIARSDGAALLRCPSQALCNWQGRPAMLSCSPPSGPAPAYPHPSPWQPAIHALV